MLPFYYANRLPCFNTSMLPCYQAHMLPCYYSNTLQRYHSTIYLVAIISPQYFATTLSLYHSTTVPQYHATKLPGYHTVLSHYYTTMLQCYHSTMPPQHFTIMLPLYHSTTLPCYQSSMLPRYYATTLTCYHAAMLPQYCTTTWRCYHASTLSQYHTTSLPHYHTNRRTKRDHKYINCVNLRTKQLRNLSFYFTHTGNCVLIYPKTLEDLQRPFWVKYDATIVIHVSTPHRPTILCDFSEPKFYLEDYFHSQLSPTAAACISGGDEDPFIRSWTCRKGIICLPNNFCLISLANSFPVKSDLEFKIIIKT